MSGYIFTLNRMFFMRIEIIKQGRNYHELKRTDRNEMVGNFRMESNERIPLGFDMFGS